MIKTGHSAQEMKLSLDAAWIQEPSASSKVLKPVTKSKALQDGLPGEPALEIKTENSSNVIPLDFLWRRRGRQITPSKTARMPCEVVEAHSGSDTLAGLWDAILAREAEAEEEAVKALQIIDASISAVRVVGSGDKVFRTRRVLVRSDRFSRPMPLGSFGDGLNRLFAIVLSLLEARGGLLLIDEFENGLHHSVQLKIWQTIFQLSSNLNVQVFATTHSRDAVETFQKAAAKSPEEGMLLRLTRTDNDDIPTVLAEQELAVVTDNWIEVR